jgi:hypothetical protein
MKSDVWAFQWNSCSIYVFGISRQDALQYARAMFPHCQYIGTTQPIADLRQEGGAMGAVTDARRIRNRLRLAALLGETF